MWRSFTPRRAQSAVIDRRSKVDASRPRGFRPPGEVQGEVEFRDVTLAYPTRAAGPMLRRFSLVASGKHVTALIGERVSGTVAAMGLVERFYDVHAGAVLLDGADVRDLDVTWLRAQVRPRVPAPMHAAHACRTVRSHCRHPQSVLPMGGAWYDHEC